MLLFLPSFTQPSSLLLYNNVDAFFFYIVRNYFLLTNSTITYTLKRHRILSQCSEQRNSGASFLFAFLDFYSLTHIFSLPFSLYLSLLFHISNSGCDKQKGFFLSKNHLCYIIARCPLSLLIPYWGFKMYFFSRNSQGFTFDQSTRYFLLSKMSFNFIK